MKWSANDPKQTEFCDANMEFLGERAFNNYMRNCNTSHSRQRFIAVFLLGLFALQAAKASFCCNFNFESISNAAALEKMPCHGDGDAESKHDGDRCLSCVSMVPGAQAAPATAILRDSDDTNPAQFDLATRPDQPYRPPIYHLS